MTCFFCRNRCGYGCLHIKYSAVCVDCEKRILRAKPGTLAYEAMLARMRNKIAALFKMAGIAV